MEQMNHNKCHDFLDTLPGPPTAWVPPHVSPSPIPPSSGLDLPTSLWKGEGWMQWIHVSKRNKTFRFEPTIPQERGGAHFWAIACDRWQIEVARVKVVVVG